MPQIRLYLAVQRLNLGQPNWDLLITAMQSAGANNQHDNISRRIHWRPSLDESIWTFEALFNSENIDEAWFVSWLAEEFNIDEAEITTTTGFNQYGRFSTFAYGGQNRIRIGVFGFQQGQGWPEYTESQEAESAYRIDNITDWETDI